MKDDWVNGLAEDWGGFLGLLGGFSHVGREPCCSRGPRKSLIASIIRWAATHTGKIGGPEWTGVVLHALHARPVCTSLGYCERYRPGSHGGPHVSRGASLTVLQTAFRHISCLLTEFLLKRQKKEIFYHNMLLWA